MSGQYVLLARKIRLYRARLRTLPYVHNHLGQHLHALSTRSSFTAITNTYCTRLESLVEIVSVESGWTLVREGSLEPQVLVLGVR